MDVVSPSGRILRAHLECAEFQLGVADGRWQAIDGVAKWPDAVFWVAAATRSNSPNGCHIKLDLDDYPRQGPTGSFWDIGENGWLAFSKRPIVNDSLTFRIDWEGIRAFYHPMDRHALGAHPEWQVKHAAEKWHEHRTIVEFLEMIYEHLNRVGYQGVRSS